MKLRMQGNSVRLRLNRKDVERFLQTGRCEETVEMAGGEMRYALESDPDAAATRAVFDAPILTVRVPQDQARRWAAEDSETGMASDQKLESGAVLTVLIEKDFACRHRPGGDADAFPNPAGPSAGLP